MGGPYLVVLDEPAGTVKVPTGSYIQVEARLGERAGRWLTAMPGRGKIGRQISVDVHFSGGAERGWLLTNFIMAATRHGQELAMSYQVVGAGGEVYHMPVARPEQAAEICGL